MIGKVIKYKFDNDSDLNTMFNGRVYPLVGAQTASYPFAIYEIATNNNQRSKDSDSHIDEINVRITIVSTSYADTQNAVSYIRNAFVRMNGTIQGVKVQSCSFDGERDLFSDNERTFSSQVDLDFRVSLD